MKKHLASKILLATTILSLGTASYLGQGGLNSVVHAEVTGKPVLPDNTTVYIHKLQADDFIGVPSDLVENVDGKMLDSNALSSLGTNVRPLPGVTFKYYLLSDSDAGKTQAELDAELKGLTETELEARLGGGTYLPTTDDTGTVKWDVSNPPAGSTASYWVIEQTAPNEVSTSLAVPFKITFPMAASNGTGYLENVHIYPKNTTALFPKAGKDVGALGNNHASYKMGDEFTWYLKGSIPLNIENYEKYEFTDVLDSKLTYVGVNKVVVAGTALETSSYNVEVQGNTVKVALTTEGIREVAGRASKAARASVSEANIADIAHNTGASPYIHVELQTKINENAVMGEAISNKTTITFDNTPNGKADPKTNVVTESDSPEVHTGGKRFIKQDATTNVSLRGAEFELLDASDMAIRWTDEMLKANNQDMFVNPQVGQPIKFKSTADGTFEIKGLSYGINQAYGEGETQYKIKETKAPVDYVLPQSSVEFRVNATSFDSYADANEYLTGQNQQIVKNNKRPAIPNTGGIGSILFIAVGLGVMVYAYRGLKKEKA